jgi:signal transduction histidine kinase
VTVPADPARQTSNGPDSAVDRLLAFFLPRQTHDVGDSHQRLRLFLISHLVGPFLGLAMAGTLFVLDPRPGPELAVITVSVLAFWLYPAALRATGRFTALAFVSLQHLSFVILFTSFHYGGPTSPFFFWIAVVPLFGFFYLGDTKRLRLAVTAALVADVIAFLVLYRLSDPSQTRIPEAARTGLGLVSVACAGIYVTLMALSNARLVVSQSELRREVENHRRTADQLRGASQAAEAASRAKSEFLATMSHELRTPLNAIIGFSQLMRAETFGALAPRYRDYAKDIDDSAEHLLEIINDILDIAKTESGRIELVDTEIDVHAVMGGVQRLLESRAAKASLTFELRLPADLPRLRADARRVKQMLLNLAGNAIKFTPAGGLVVLAAERSAAGGLALRVTDTGIGIAPDKLAKVLEPFYQVDSSLARRHEGTGLGLPLVAAMAAWHDASLRLESGLGTGTTVVLEFPPARMIDEGVRRDQEEC